MHKILGISAFYHDSASALVVDGQIIAAAQEERFTRKKHTPDFPVNAIRYCLEEGGYEIDELDAIVFYEKPLLKFERLLQTYYAFAPKGLISFLKAIPVWLNEKLFLKKLIYDGLKEVGTYKKQNLKLLFSEHHLSHAASAFYPSSFEKAAILTIDAVGEWSTVSIGLGDKNRITPLKSMDFPNSVGLLYSSFTYYLGFKVNSGEYKLMGLAPYGIPESKNVSRFMALIKEKLVDIKDDGSIWMNQAYFNYSTGLRMIKHKKWEQLFGFKKREEEAEINSIHCDFALASQKVIEEIVFKLAKEAKKLTNTDYLCLAGGVALNSVANGKLLKSRIFKSIYIQPAAGDSGGALGAALAVHYLYHNNERLIDYTFDNLQGAYLGPDYSEKEIQTMNKRVKSVSKNYSNYTDLSKFIASKISEGHIIGWFQGRMEFGPRALGNRSILADPRNPEMQSKLNLKIKYREGFRPFAPSVLEGDCEKFFELKEKSPYMLFVSPVKEARRKNLPGNYQKMTMREKLNVDRSDISSVTHLDFSARIQTVQKGSNHKYWELINEFKELSGIGVLINTSFNVRGEPIVCSPYDAYRCFMSTDMDYLVINDFVYYKKDQPNWEDKEQWSTKFQLD